MSLGIFKKAWNTTQLNSLVQTITNMVSAGYVAKDYKEYIANISQSGTSAPSMTVIKNDFSTPTANYSNTGTYTLVFDGDFTGNVAVLISNGSTISSGVCGAKCTDANTITIYSVNTSFSLADDVITGGSIYIRMYN